MAWSLERPLVPLRCSSIGPEVAGSGCRTAVGSCCCCGSADSRSQPEADEVGNSDSDIGDGGDDDTEVAGCNVDLTRTLSGTSWTSTCSGGLDG